MELLVFGHTHHWVACYTHHGKSCTLVLIYCFGSPEIGYFILMSNFQSLPGRFRPFCMKLSVHCSHIFYIVQDIIPPHDSSHLHIVHRMSLKAGLTKPTNIRPTLISFRADALFNCWNWRTTWTRSTLYSTIIVYSIEWHFCCVAVNVSTNRDPLYFWQCHHQHFTSNSPITNLKPPILMQLNFIRTAWLRNLKVKMSSSWQSLHTLSHMANSVVEAPRMDAQYMELKLLIRPLNSIVKVIWEPYEVTRLFPNALPGIVQYT